MSQTIFCTTDERLEAEFQESVDHMLARLAAADDLGLPLFIHGGPVFAQVGASTAAALASVPAVLVDRGWGTGFPVWHCRVGETIEINQAALSRELRFVRMILRLIAWADRKMGGGVVDKAFVDAGDASGALAALAAKSQPGAGALEAMLSQVDR